MSRLQRAFLTVSFSALTLTTVALPATSFAAPATATAGTYVVKQGDFLAGIAAKVGVALPQLLSANNLTTKSVILPGDKLAIPVGSATAQATAPAAAPVSSGPVAGSLVHTVKSGDYLLGIATLYGVTLSDLMAVNHLTLASLILPGTQLALPSNAVASKAAVSATAAPAAAGSGSLTYVVKAGDFLAGIASAYKVKLPDLLAANKLKAGSLILPGAKLVLPAGAVAPSATSAAVVAGTAGPAGTVVAYAYAQLGKPYRFFTAGPDTFDCSGLVKAAFAQIGMEVVHHSASQALLGTPVDFWSEPIKAGDLVFMATHGTGEINHVGIAVNATHWIHAPKPGDVVRLAPIPPKGVLTTVKRLIPAT